MTYGSLLLGSVATTAAAERVFQIDLATQHDSADKVRIERVGAHEYEWSLPDGIGQNLHIDLPGLGIDPKSYDEFRFDLKPMGSQVRLQAVIFDLPAEGEISSWFSKFRSVTDEWSSGRFDLRIDDDGAQYPARFGDYRPGVMRLSLTRRALGFPGEPQWRKAIMRNPRLVRRVVSADFEPRDLQFVSNAAELSYTYHLLVRNRTDKPLTAQIELDPDQDLRLFRADLARLTTSAQGELQADTPLSIDLAAGEQTTIPIRLWIEQSKALALSPGYAESICPRVWVDGLADSEVQPLIGFRRMPMWAVVPPQRPAWTPPAFQARVAAAATFMVTTQWTNTVLTAAERALAHDWPAYDWLTPGQDPLTAPHWGQSYRCPACQSWLRMDPPDKIGRHVCSNARCGKVVEGDPRLDQAARQEYFAHRFADVRTLAVAWLLTGDSTYADKALAIALAYADAYPSMTVLGTRSTSGGSKLSKTTLGSSWQLHKLAEGYAMLATYDELTEDKRQRIDAMLIDEGLRMARHAVEYTNMQGEHVRSYGSVALATGYWPLLGEAIHGEFGWHEIIEYGFSEDGFAHEGQAYHKMLFDALSHFAVFAADRGIDLLTWRFKRVFDGSQTMGYAGPAFELPYRQYRDPAYLAALDGARRDNAEISILHGEPGLAAPDQFPAVSRLMDGMGYLFLRRGTAADSWEIRLNYKEQFDRGEADRFTTFFFRNGLQMDASVGRMFYTVPGQEWQTFTPAHNVIVIDGQNSRHVHGELVSWQGQGDTPIAVVADDPDAPLFEGVRLLRGIALLGDAYVVFDRVVAETPRTIDRYQYGKGTAKLHFPAAPPDTPLANLPEAGRFSNLQTGQACQELRIDFQNHLNMRLVSDQDMTGCKALTFAATGPIEVTWARLDHTTEATFLATFSLGKDSQPPHARIIKSTDDEIVFEVTAPDQAFVVTIRPGDKTAEVVTR